MVVEPPYAMGASRFEGVFEDEGAYDAKVAEMLAEYSVGLGR